ncbi:MAG: 4-(cytidine 5'-diphospho)-2-C-methyl-D-erythritol kinase [Desulfobacterales bacterium]|jgi:4-diphosphocytidyl-2-C-methyl-D-erythritol kinase
MIQINAPAKINLFLQVTGKRPDGYHELFTLMCPLGLADRIRLDPTGARIRVTCTDPAVPADTTNTTHRAAEIFFRNLPKSRHPPLTGVKITIEKQIPVGAGLGGGSSDAAAVFRGLNRLLGYPFQLAELMEMGREVGADVPFFIFGHPALATGIGERLEPYRKLPPYRVLLFYPVVNVSTAEVYKNLDLGLTNCKKKLKDFVLKQRPFDAALHLCNDLETVTLNRYPQVKAAKEALDGRGALGVSMSGSGSTVFALFADDGMARRALQSLEGITEGSFFLTQLIVDADAGSP